MKTPAVGSTQQLVHKGQMIFAHVRAVLDLGGGHRLVSVLTYEPSNDPQLADGDAIEWFQPSMKHFATVINRLVRDEESVYFDVVVRVDD